MKRLLCQTQLSNYTPDGRWVLECDSGWQMCMGRIRQMLKLNPDLQVDIMGPCLNLDGQCQVVTPPHSINPDLFETGRVRYLEHWIQPNALATRYDFDYDSIGQVTLKLGNHKSNPNLRYDAVYINDPMHLRNFKALFMLMGGYRPNFYVHSHFVDVPSCPKFPTEASLWLGQCEAAIKADFNFWQCESAMHEFFIEMAKVYQPAIVKVVKDRSLPWDDGYSQEEITAPVDENQLRFTKKQWDARTQGKVVIFVPNRIGGKGRSSDYTNCGKFMFELLPRLREVRQDFVVICGNPSQKFTNEELEQWCAADGYVSLVPDAFTRDEFKFVASHSDIAVGLYDQDTYGGTAARECVELGCMPLWLATNEYLSIAREADVDSLALVKKDFSNLTEVLGAMIDDFRNYRAGMLAHLPSLQRTVRERCSYEETTKVAMMKMGLLGERR